MVDYTEVAILFGQLIGPRIWKDEHEDRIEIGNLAMDFYQKNKSFDADELMYKAAHYLRRHGISTPTEYTVELSPGEDESDYLKDV